MEEYRVSFYDISNQELKSVILEFTYLEMITDAKIYDLYWEAEEIKNNYMSKRAQEIGVCSCDGLHVWKKLSDGQWVRVRRG